MKKFAILFVLFVVLVGCQSETAVSPQPTAIADAATSTIAVQEPTATLEPTLTAVPTATDEPTATPNPTNTAVPEPTNTPRPTNTPAKTQPTNTPQPEKPTAVATSANSGESTTAIQEDPLQFIYNAESNAQKQSSMTMRQVVTLDASVLQQTMIQTCGVVLPDQTYCETKTTIAYAGSDPISTSNEVVQIGDLLWLREEGGDWQELSADDLGMTDEAMEQLRLSQFMTSAEWAGEATIDNIPTYALIFEMNVADYFTFLMGAEIGDTLPLDDTSGSGTLWIGQDDQLVRKALVEMAFAIEGEMLVVTTQAAYSGYNEPVKIPDPREEAGN